MAENEVQRSLGRIEGKIDSMNERLDRHTSVQDAHDRRISVLETQIARAFGYAIGAGAAGGLLLTIVKAVL